MMNSQDAQEVVKLLQVFWPIEWSQRMARDMETRLATELAFMFEEYTLDEVRTVIRALATSVDRPPTYKQILRGLQAMQGKDPKALPFRWEVYAYKFYRDDLGREYVKTCNVKIYPDGRVETPKGIKKDYRLMRRQDIIDENGIGIYDFEAHLKKWGPVWRERQKKILDGMDPREAIRTITPETMGTADKPQGDPESEEGEIPEGFQQVIDDIFNEW